MKVKKLEWESSGINFHESKNISLYNIHLLDNRYVKNKFEPRYGKAVFDLCDNLEEAKMLCQSHFERLILSQIETEVKEFDPLALGFELVKDISISPLVFKCYLRKTGKYYLRLSERLDRNNPKSWNQYNLIEVSDIDIFDPDKYSPKKMLFDDIKIPDHDFGIKLVSQFLEVE